jgi:hypothetical protein
LACRQVSSYRLKNYKKKKKKKTEQLYSTTEKKSKKEKGKFIGFHTNVKTSKSE